MPKPIIDVHALAERMAITPEEAQRLGERFFTSLAKAESSLGEALIAASRNSRVRPKQVKGMLDLFAADFRAPLPPETESLGERVSDLASDARDRLTGMKDRVATGIAAIDVAALREEGGEKVARLRQRAAEIDVAEIGDQARELGARAVDGARDLAGQVRNKVKAKKDAKSSPPWADE
ncbi:hypothetical protein [Erythrobacter sp. JK5]|uniref:hypothetical protein n=1 Tax=Erythrobacter sp. JK5 TaxID=2829500 RepID=UPI001BA7C750|nr:hypothetical protein [Erythrobacter sp. JK5]QUL38361.1 hypothetical protein KDC96_02800 [Erythrobacter sp. JK5]